MQASRMYFASLISLSLLASACEKKEKKVSLPEKSVLSDKAPADTAAKGAEATPAPAANGEAMAATGLAAVPIADKPAEGAPAAAAPTAGDQVQLSFPGAVSSQRRSTLSFRVPGFIESIKLKAGNSCKKGSVLATIDSRDYKLAVNIAKSNLDVAKSNARNAEAEYKREGELKAQNASSESVYDRLKATYENSKANTELAQFNLTKAEQALGDTRLLAPYDCVISKQLSNVGESVKAGDGAFEVYDVTDIEVSFNVPERMAGRLKLGEKIDVRIPATGFQGSLDIVRIVAVVDDKTRTFQIVAKAPQGDVRVVPGLYAEGIVR
ncbi:MAG: efflux RND transporter periplasmic adaptor subunit [Oligoflexus sp.]|nr:efflux RND transporter periplasmic adaptor subunit [Oligoflexus sp.]